MKCENCGYEMMDYENTCDACGWINYGALEQNGDEVAENSNVEKNNFCQATGTTNGELLTKRNVYLFGIISNAIIIILGIFSMFGMFNNKIVTTSAFSSGSTEYTTSYTYGGDAYTGMQNASADASNNAAVAAENIEITNELTYGVVRSVNSLQGVVSGTVGLLIVSIGIFGLCYFCLGYIEEISNN